MPTTSQEAPTATRHLILLVVLYSLAVVVTLQPVIDPDIWWHLRTGEWILQHGTVPTTDPFSAYGQGKPWLEYSWLFDLATYGLYQAAGLRGFLVYQFILLFAILLALQHLVMLVTSQLARSTVLATLAFMAMVRLSGPRSYLVSILFFVLVMIAVVRAHRDGRRGPLYLLPLLFVLWANIHIQFVYGLVILGAVTLDAMLTRWWDGAPDSPIPLKALLLVDAGCVLATLVTPYHVRLYAVLHDVAAQTGVYWFNEEMRAPQFRFLTDWVVLGLTLGGAFVLDRARHPRFLVLLYLLGVFVSFRSGRDVWFVVVCAALIVAMTDTASGDVLAAREMPPGTRWRAAVITVVIFAVLCSLKPSATLEAEVKGKFPDGAARAVMDGGYTGPMYNHFNWGGYLIWRLPTFLVSMDGRSHVHGDARILQALRTWSGLGDWESDPELSRAGVVIASTDMALASLLRHDRRFREVYSDDIARVFVARPGPATSPTRP